MRIFSIKNILNILLFINFFYTVPLTAADDFKVKIDLIGIKNVQDKKSGKVVPTSYVGETFKIKVVVSGGNRNTGQVEIEGLDNLTVDGTSKSTSVIVQNANFISEVVYIYDAHSDSEGTFRIGPAKVRHDGKIISSNPEYLDFIVEEKKGKSGKVFRSNEDLSNFLNNFDSDDSDDLFCDLTIDKDNVVVGEPLMLNLNIYSQGDILQVGLEPPKFDGFLSNDIEGKIKRREERDGKIYSVLEKKFILFPLQSGIKTISPIKVRFNVPVKNRRLKQNFLDDDFFHGFFGPAIQTKKTSSNSLEVNVEELPQTKFAIDGVGNFKSFSAKVDKNEAVINEPILLSLQIEGEGNLDQISAPKLDLPSFFRNYESKTQIHQDSSNGYPKGKKMFEFVVQVGRAGIFKIPSQKFNYFDIESRNYKTLTTNPIELNIKVPVGTSETQDDDEIKNQKNFGQTLLKDSNDKMKEYKKDINFIEEGLFTPTQEEKKPLSVWLFLIFMLFPFLLYSKIFSSPIFGVIKFKFFGVYLKKKALGRFKNKLESIIDKKETNKIYKFFLNYFSDKFEVSQSDVNEDFIEKKLLDLGITQEKINDFLIFLSECASLSFAKSMSKNVDYEKLLEKSRYWFFILEG